MPSDAEEWRRVTDGAVVTGDMFLANLEYEATEAVANGDKIQFAYFPDSIRVVTHLSAIYSKKAITVDLGYEAHSQEFAKGLAITANSTAVLSGGKNLVSDPTDEPIVLTLKITTGSLAKGDKIAVILVGTTLC